MTPQVRIKIPPLPASQNCIAITGRIITREKVSKIFSAYHAALGWTNRIKSIAIILFALLLFSGSACTKVSVSVRQHTSSSRLSELTGTHCKLQRELRNQDQKTNVWCWAASAHTVVEYLKNEPIEQCQLVHAFNRINLQDEWNRWLVSHPDETGDPPSCCMNMPEVEPAPTETNKQIAQRHCYQNGYPENIFFTEEYRTHFERYDYDWTIPYPNGLSWNEIVEEICADRPMISAWLYARQLGQGVHFVVIGGYSELDDGSQWVHVYDPSFNTMEEDFYLQPYDVYLGDPGVFTHARAYKNIYLQ